MKKKIFSTLFALVLLLTLGLVTAVPTGAIPTPAAVSFETWDGGGGSDNWSYTAPNSGSYCVELSGPMIVKVAYGETLQTLADVTQITVDSHTVWDIKWEIYDTSTLNLHAKIYLDTDLDGEADTVLTGGFGAVTGGSRAVGSWFDAYIRTDAAWGIETYDGVDYTGGATIATVVYSSYPPGYTLSTLLADGTSGATWAAATVVDLAYGYATGTEAYVDDITVDAVVYEVEPPLPPLDDDDYKVDDVATVTIYDIDANTNAAVRETILVDAAGSIPVHSIVLGLLETGIDTGVFTETFTLVGTSPGTAELLVSHGSVITVTYDTLLVVTADVDNVAPVITVVAPTVSENITDATPLIQADYTEAGSGVDNATAVMTLNTVTVTPDTSTTTEITYTPSANLTDGTYAVTVAVSDIVGNAATLKSWSFTVDTVDPTITVATPAVVPPSVSSNITFTATVADVTSGVDTVTINVSSIDSATALAMTDDGGGTYSVNVTTSSTITEATYKLLVTATDFATNSVSANITLIVSSDTTAPVISSPAITYLFGLNSVPPGGTVTISANVTEAVGMGSVTAACTAFTGSVSLLDGGSAPDATAGDDIYTGTATVATGVSGNYAVTIAAVDAKSNVAIPDTSLTLTVAAATGSDITLADGWNLISLPLIPTDGSIDVVIADISDNVSQVRTWVYEADVLTEKVWINDGPAGFTVMAAGRGYWILMTEANELTVQGVELPAPPLAPPSYSVYEGWNLVGFKSVSVSTAADYLGGAVTSTFERMYGYNAAGGVYTVIQVATDNLTPGQGYWLAVSADGTIYP